MKIVTGIEGYRVAKTQAKGELMSDEFAYSYRVQPGTSDALTQNQLRKLQLRRLNETLQWARENCRYYLDRLPAVKLGCLEDLESLPLMDETAFDSGLTSLLGSPQHEISRIVTVPTSGTTGNSKRIAFSRQEQADIVRYLAAGMRMLAMPGETIAVLYPCEHEGGLGRLICEAVQQAGARVCAYGLPNAERGFDDLAEVCRRERARGIVGFPQHILALARWCDYRGVRLEVQRVLLSADNVVIPVKHEIARIWQAQVFAHYGTTEMGYGGAVECTYGTGLHIRETDLLFEIIDPLSGAVLPQGSWGELVFTTLNRRAMPLVRYRTGDKTRLLAGDCACGSALRRIDEVRGRAVCVTLPQAGRILAAAETQPATSAVLTGVAGTQVFNMYDLEELVFSSPSVLDFSAAWNRGDDLLELEVQHLAREDRTLSVLKTKLEEKTGTKIRLQLHSVSKPSPLYTGKRFIRIRD